MIDPTAIHCCQRLLTGAAGGREARERELRLWRQQLSGGLRLQLEGLGRAAQQPAGVHTNTWGLVADVYAISGMACS